MDVLMIYIALSGELAVNASGYHIAKSQTFLYKILNTIKFDNEKLLNRMAG